MLELRFSTQAEVRMDSTVSKGLASRRGAKHVRTHPLSSCVGEAKPDQVFLKESIRTVIQACRSTFSVEVEQNTSRAL